MQYVTLLPEYSVCKYKLYAELLGDFHGELHLFSFSSILQGTSLPIHCN
jgi:hypothetical protein